jgi:hypothetical protein
MLIETSNNDAPPTSELGTTEELLTNSITGTGHVSRNIRLSLLAAEMVEPYLTFTNVGWSNGCYAESISLSTGKVVLQWTVGGTMRVDSTQLWYAKWEDLPDEMKDCNYKQPDIQVVETLMQKGVMQSVTTGTGIFSKTGGTGFSGSIDLTSFSQSDRLVVFATARVDQAWGTQENVADIRPNLPPQSHIVNARTNENWLHESAGKIIQGRLDWVSLPLVINLEATPMPTTMPSSVAPTCREKSDACSDSAECCPSLVCNQKRNKCRRCKKKKKKCKVDQDCCSGNCKENARKPTRKSKCA